MIGQTNSQTASKVTESTVSGWGFTKGKIDIEDVNESVEDLEVEYATKGYVDNKIEEIKESQADIDLSDYAKKTDLQGKVDKVAGKQLSTEDFTTALKNKLNGLSNYDDTEINAAVSSLQTQLDTLVSGNANDAINSFNEIVAFLDGIKDSQDLSSIIASIERQIASKMDKVTLSNVATSGSYNDLKDKPAIPSAVTESTVSSWGFTKNAGTVTGVTINGTTKVPSGGVVDLGTVVTAHQDISGKQDKLISGTNIKTVNGQSILGSGNITIEGGSGGGGGSIDPELLEAYMPMSRDFSDDFNSSFAR